MFVYWYRSDLSKDLSIALAAKFMHSWWLLTPQIWVVGALWCCGCLKRSNKTNQHTQHPPRVCAHSHHTERAACCGRVALFHRVDAQRAPAGGATSK